MRPGRGFTLLEALLTIGLAAVILAIYSALLMGVYFLSRTEFGVQATSFVQEGLDALRTLEYEDLTNRTDGNPLGLAFTRGDWNVVDDSGDQILRLPLAETDMGGETGLVVLPGNYRTDFTMTADVKVRGAANKILSLCDEEKQKGVITFSTGNHGKAVAFVAGRTGVKAVVCLSEHVASYRADMIEKLGAEISVKGKSQDEAEKNYHRLAASRGLVPVVPFDDPMIIAGQGTIALEILAVLPDTDVLFPFNLTQGRDRSCLLSGGKGCKVSGT